MASIGERLREARVAKNKSLVDISNETNISKKYLEALEEDNYDAFPAEVYVRGFLKNYSKFLGIESQGILDDYNKLMKLDVVNDYEKRVEKHEEDDSDIFKMGEEIVGEGRKSRKGFVIALIVIIIAILGVLAYLYSQNMILSTGG
jgi:cytoskeletal protein RodZ